MPRLDGAEFLARSLAANGTTHVFFIDAGQGHGHTGLVVGREGNEFQTIEGNTNELGGREGIGVFARSRPVRQATLGFVEFAAR